MGLNLFIDVPLFENIPASAIPALLYICCINSAAGFVCHMMAMEKTSAQEASLIFFLKPILAPIFALIFLKEEIPLNMIVGIVCFMGGVQLVCLGVIGEYIGKIYMETKARPRYIISERTWAPYERKYHG